MSFLWRIRRLKIAANLSRFVDLYKGNELRNDTMEFEWLIPPAIWCVLVVRSILSLNDSNNYYKQTFCKKNETTKTPLSTRTCAKTAGYARLWNSQEVNIGLVQACRILLCQTQAFPKICPQTPHNGLELRPPPQSKSSSEKGGALRTWTSCSVACSLFLWSTLAWFFPCCLQPDFFV